MKAEMPTTNRCPKCGDPRIPHRVCPTCGTYRGEQVIEVEEI
jgi:large subunit ribosomal protein L32